MPFPSMIFKIVELSFRPLHVSSCSSNFTKFFRFNQHRKNISRIALCSKIINCHAREFGFCSVRLKCSKSSGFQIRDNSLRTSLRWRKCTLTNRSSKCSSKKIISKCRSKQPVESIKVHSSYVASLKETKRKVAKKMEELRENVLTVPNALCVARMAVCPVLGYLVIQEFYTTSLGIFILAGVTDVVDGYIARTFPSQRSVIGSFLDPMADKLLVATLFLSLTVNGLIPVPLTSLIIFRDLCLVAAGFYIRYVSLPPPKTVGRYFDVSFATAQLSPTNISKANTLVQLSLVAFSLAAPVFGFVDHLLLEVLWYVTGTTTVLSAASYMYYKNTYKILMLKSKVKK